MSPDTRARRRVGGPAASPEDFPDEDRAYRELTPSERIAALELPAARARGHAGGDARLHDDCPC